MIEIIKDKETWNNLVGKCDMVDFYHTYDYHHAAKAKGEDPVLIHYTEDNKTVALPLLFRNIAYTVYKDATSVYGYPGPITKNITKHFDNTKFRNQLKELLIENKIVSIFSRLNPLIEQQEVVLKGLGEICLKGRVVNIDLTKDLLVQKNEYQNRLRTYVNKSRKTCTVVKAQMEKDIPLFADLYHENMRRVKASDKYFFKKEYFHQLVNSKDFESEILLALDNTTGEVIAGALFIKKNNIVQYHLSGTKKQNLHLNPIKLLIDEMRIIATRENYKFFNLGGGLGNKEDSLFTFKSRFSKDYKSFKVWEYIANEKVYNDLVEQEQSPENMDLGQKQKDFFPLYRFTNN